MNTKNLQRVLELTKYNKKAGHQISNAMQPGVAAKITGANGHTVKVSPNNSKSITTEIPVGKPVVDLNIPLGLPVEDVVSIYVDLRDKFDPSSPTFGKTKIVLFDEGRYYEKSTGFSGNPSNVVYIDSPELNLYAPWVSEGCSHAYILDMLTIDVTAASYDGATKAKTQLDQKIQIFRTNVKDSYKGFIDPSQFKDTKDIDSTQRLIPLTGIDSRVDRQVAWVLEGYDGMLIRLDLHVAAKVQY